MGRMTWRGRARGPFRALVAGIVAGLVAGAIGWSGIEGLRPRTAMTGRAVAMDGDSLRLDGVELRLEGLDAPELRQTCVAATGEVACGRMARDTLAALLDDGAVTCRVGKRDRYGRGLAQCSAGGRDVNRELVRSGAAIASGDYEAEEREARSQRRGVWATRFEQPADWRARH
jgi:endonuclease YncB( thermonuclease family)